MQIGNVPSSEVKHIWDQACAQLQIQLSPAVYNTWIVSNPVSTLDYLEDNKCLATITSPTAFHSTNLKKNLHLQIKQSLDKATGKICEIQYVIGSVSFSPTSNKSGRSQQSGFSTVGKTIRPELNQNNHGTGKSSDSFFAESQNLSSSSGFNTQSPRVEDLFSESILTSASEDRTAALVRAIGLRKDYTFETFAVSTTNEMAHAAATAVSNRPGTAYNPLFLYGGVGVGKTHLMHAIGSNIIKNDPNKKIIYCTGEEFTNEIVQSIQKKNTSLFKSKFRNADVLLIDDVQFIAGKNAVQEEFFHTFNALSKQQGQIVLTSDRPPHEMNLLEDRLRSRFEAGLMIDIQVPSFELRTAILLVKSKAAGLSIPIDIAKTIASRVESARKIEGVITSIRSEVELKGKFISEELINSLLDTEIVEKRPSINTSPSEIIKTVANHYRLKQTALKGKRRVKSLVVARHIAMYLLKNELNLPLAEIGRWFSGRDHTSVLHAVRKVEKDLKTNDLIMRDISALRTTLSLTSR
ncbi:MAG: chromosomal replication initiator protein DnaA [Candidatus Pacebacteria bacterium CG_4_10_14_3_um_filter_34_15]|nr:chromosomal replication initiator protein DnaA [Candidatus Pacearchaeota archaeon]NCQ65662.1 chromosomal replication initiator protein DnaA [Candidatus Paceibacterota bacterium]OIO43713.1 MAG: chromosomal replication initiator protein DnaA [Candidatus Pacebacteria bacterium CG1_02_43_31]PIQ80669.1 MAG: chromosomal replication initiator protein DnaA [Candidatus Pacebacteria bacterium CG11_big_fil_rev_8_21_14_0_20_34_55]PIX81981.1 MAG: chromosomal replication initiator protein DnaA [Candidatus